jgi:hypothetical protein
MGQSDDEPYVIELEGPQGCERLRFSSARAARTRYNDLLIHKGYSPQQGCHSGERRAGAIGS